MCVSAINWVMDQGQQVVARSLAGTVASGLSVMKGVTSRAHFSVALIQGLSANLTEDCRQEFCHQVSLEANRNHFNYIFTEKFFFKSKLS